MKLKISHKIADKIQKSDLSSDLQYAVDVLGIEQVRKLIVEMGGTGSPIYIPDASSFDKPIYRMLEEDFSGDSIRDISLRTGISQRRLKGIYKKYRKEHST